RSPPRAARSRRSFQSRQELSRRRQSEGAGAGCAPEPLARAAVHQNRPRRADAAARRRIRRARPQRRAAADLDAGRPSGIGQNDVNQAEGFSRQIDLSGIILTKMDGDARGGAALSMREIVGKPILFSGTGEKPDALEPFYPDRLATRILGMGDVLSLIEKTQQVYDAKETERLLKQAR